MEGRGAMADRLVDTVHLASSASSPPQVWGPFIVCVQTAGKTEGFWRRGGGGGG